MADMMLIWEIPPENMAGIQGKIIEDENEFLNDLEAFHHQRGTSFDRNVRASGRSINLFSLYKLVVSLGGYDVVSGERLAWRQLVKPFGLGDKPEGQMTFALKSTFYKYLAAYEIARFWGEEPPPKEILEDLTAKGGDLRNRRPENYVRSANVTGIDGGEEDLDDEAHTPKRERMDLDDPLSGTKYPSRLLRQDPKRTQMYQPDPSPQRPRYGHFDSPQPLPPVPVQQYSQPSIDPRNPNFTVDKYEPRQPIALTLRPMITPGSNPDAFYQRKAMERAQTLPKVPADPHWLSQLRHSVAPNYFSGPSIYNRCHMGLMSGIKQEEDFALHHLVKVSFERGDKFTFSGFPGLAEALMAKCLQISDIVYNLSWKISYDQAEAVTQPKTLNASFETPNLRETILSLPRAVEERELDSPDIHEKLERLNEAALIIRNMITLEGNAVFIAKQALFKDFLIVAVNLPHWSQLTEFHQYALEMAEQATRYWSLAPNDPLYISLLQHLESNDRGEILSALRAISRIGIETDDTFKVENVPEATLDRLIAFLLLDDDELVEATLDLLYELTAVDSNVTASLQHDASLIPSIVPRLQEFLLHNATAAIERVQTRALPSTQQLAATIPNIPHDLYLALLQYPEPDRSSRWLRCCFQESAEDDITQIAIWQAYQQRFAHPNAIQAADFIKNVSTTFSQAQAQVINAQPQPRFIIKGIKPRRMLVDMQGRPFWKCLWEVQQNHHNAQAVYDDRGIQRYICGSWHDSRQNLWGHMLQNHVGLKYDSASQKFDNSAETNAAMPGKTCGWVGCARQAPFGTAREMSIHVRGHIPETTDIMSRIIEELATMPHPGQIGRPGAKGKSLAGGESDMYTHHTFYHTVIDERGHPAGIPFMAVMVMRNLARFVGRHGGKVIPALTGVPTTSSSAPPLATAASSRADADADADSKAKTEAELELERRELLMSRFFNSDVRAELWNVMFVHRTLTTLVQDLMNLIQKGESGGANTRQAVDAEGQNDDEINTPAAAAGHIGSVIVGGSDTDMTGMQ